MQNINWDTFGVNGQSKQDSFEDLCMYLCCRKLKITEIEAYKNQPGIETEPFEVNGKKYGFQSKYFNSGFKWAQIEHSILGKRDKEYTGIDLKSQYPDNVFAKYNLHKVLVYSNEDKTLKGRNKTDSETRLTNIAKLYTAHIEFITDKNFMLQLSKPLNFDLAQLYFHVGDELGFIRDSINPLTFTFTQSSEYLDLPFLDNKDKKVIDILKILQTNKNKIVFIKGQPGSGKSIYMHKVFEAFAGLTKNNITEMENHILKNNAIPVLVNLKNCVSNSLESILRGRKSDYKINGSQLSFIYLLDGLDELLNEEAADSILNEIYEISNKSSTKSIIISCRLGNNNLLKARSYFRNKNEYQIAPLGLDFIMSYFRIKKPINKIKNLNKLVSINPKLIKDINDILLVKLLWETIDQLDKTSSSLDLFNKKINILLDDPRHRKNLDRLNLLNPKKESLIELNNEISYQFQKKFQLRFTDQELLTIILEKYERIDYKSANEILNFNKDLFFENQNTTTNTTTYIYQHRRYQEYFFTNILKIKYRQNSNIIRNMNIISNREYFEEMFLKSLRKDYILKNDLAGMTEINLINVYLGNHQSFSPDPPIYIDSNEFLQALSQQDESIINELVEDDSLNLKKLFFVNIDLVKESIKNVEQLDTNTREFLIDTWENKFSLCIKYTAIFWKNNKTNIAHELLEQLISLQDILFENKYIKKLVGINESITKKKTNNPIWDQIESWIYIKLIIKEENIKSFFNVFVRSKYSMFNNESIVNYRESSKERLLKSFFRTCFNEQKEDVFELVTDFDSYEATCFFNVLADLEYLYLLDTIKDKMHIKQYLSKITFLDVSTIFFKSFYKIKLDTNEIKFVKKKRADIVNKRPVDWRIYNLCNEYSLLSFILKKNVFSSLLINPEDTGGVFLAEKNLYSALFNDYILLLTENYSIKNTFRHYIQFVQNRHFNDQFELNLPIEKLWSCIYDINKEFRQTFKSLINLSNSQVNKYLFYYELNKLAPDKFIELVDLSDLEIFESETRSWESDYSSLIDRYFELTQLYSAIDKNKSKYYFQKGISEGLLRHGWRKDIVVSDLLVSSLGILLKNNWCKNNIKNYTKGVFNLTLKVLNITDGKGTRYGPYNLIKTLAKYDINLAEELKASFFKNKSNIHSHLRNLIISTILKNKIRLGVSLKTIENEILELGEYHDYIHDFEPDYYENKFIVYLQLAESEFYSEKDRKTSFTKAYKIVSNLNSSSIKSYLNNDQYREEKLRFNKLCTEFNIQSNLNIGSIKKRRKKDSSGSIEKKFIQEVTNSKTIKQINGKFTKLKNFNNKIILKEKESWEMLINKTIEIHGNIEPFLDLLKRWNFPHFGRMSYNAEYFHLGLSIAIGNPITKNQTFSYLYENSGYEGFYEILRAYEELNDENMCIKLFNRFYKFCDLIVN